MTRKGISDMLNRNKNTISAEEYLIREESAENRSEYYHGEVFAMAGGTPNHNRITVNLVSLLNSQFRGGPCEAFASDMRVQVEHHVHYAYPDVVVVCGKIELAKGRPDTIVNPLVIIEVLSESTKDYDRGSKFTAYRSIETLMDYILVDQDTLHIEYFAKEGDGTWRLREYFGAKSVMELQSVGATLPMAAIYERVALAPQTGIRTAFKVPTPSSSIHPEE